MMPLIFANTGEENIIKKVGGSPETRKFLESLGFVAGGSVNVLGLIFAALVPAFMIFMPVRPYKESTRLTEKVKV
ncbi:MAG: hypothetical protein ACI4XA_00885 [Oscillospiraceae bacterium]